jgi:hypothetical protein
LLGLLGISKNLWHPTPSRLLSYDSETSPSLTPTPTSGGTHQHEQLSSGGGGVTPPVEKRKKFHQLWSIQLQTQTQNVQLQQQSQGMNRKKRGDYNFAMETDIQGIACLRYLVRLIYPRSKTVHFPPIPYNSAKLTDNFFFFFIRT